MATRVGIVSDVHASPKALDEALRLFATHQVKEILCAGDIAGYFADLDETISLLINAGVKTISGNHDAAWLSDHQNDASDAARFLQQLPQSMDLEYEGISLRMIHAEPPEEQHGGIKLLDEDGDIIPEQKAAWSQTLADYPGDVLIVGHTHQVYAEKLGDTLVINPGSSAFNHSCAILELPAMKVTFYSLEGYAILKSWNFSMLRRSNKPYPPRKK